MRLDKFLKVSRLIKRRTVAKEIADQGRIDINGKTSVLRIDKIVETTKKDESEEMYTIVDEKYTTDGESD